MMPEEALTLFFVSDVYRSLRVKHSYRGHKIGHA